MDQLIAEMSRLLGEHIVYEGVPCEVIDVLIEGPSLVLARRDGAESVIQRDEHGDPRRRVPRTYTVPLQSEITPDLHPVVLRLAAEDQLARLRQLAGLTSP